MGVLGLAAWMDLTDLQCDYENGTVDTCPRHLECCEWRQQHLPGQSVKVWIEYKSIE